MANLTSILAIISILLVIIANASAYRTTITTIEIDDSEGSSSQQCRQEVQKKDLSSCEQYLSQSHSESSPGEESLIKMAGDESQQQAERQQLQQCCSEVKQLRDECQCEAIKTIVQQLSQRGEKHDYPQVIHRAGDIQSSCGLSQCSIRTYPTQQSCDEQIQRQRDLRQCQDYIRQKVSQQGSSRGGSQQQLGRCCDHLIQMQSQCRCQGLSHAIEQQQSKGQLQGQDVFEAFRTAKELPRMCGVAPSECQF